MANKKDKISRLDTINNIIDVLRRVYLLILLYGSLVYFIINPDVLKNSILITLIKHILTKT